MVSLETLRTTAVCAGDRNAVSFMSSADVIDQVYESSRMLSVRRGRKNQAVGEVRAHGLLRRGLA
jgi:hypothetical protein